LPRSPGLSPWSLDPIQAAGLKPLRSIQIRAKGLFSFRHSFPAFISGIHFRHSFQAFISGIHFSHSFPAFISVFISVASFLDHPFCFIVSGLPFSVLSFPFRWFCFMKKFHFFIVFVVLKSAQKV
jgi:hypothetical protein